MGVINELIEQIGGHAALIDFAENGIQPSWVDSQVMARALLAVLDAQSNPVAYAISDKEDREAGRLGKLSFTGVGSYSDEDVNEYELCDTPLYTVPPAASVPDGLAVAVNLLLDSDGSRGTFSAIRRGNALAEVERLLAAAPGGDGE